MRKLRISHNPSLITPTSKVQLKDKIYIAGHRGLAGSALVRRLRAAGFANLLCRTHAELDLTDQGAVRKFFAAEKPDCVFIAAAKVGGIHANNTQPADFIFQNLAIEQNVIENTAAMDWNSRMAEAQGRDALVDADTEARLDAEHVLEAARHDQVGGADVDQERRVVLGGSLAGGDADRALVAADIGSDARFVHLLDLGHAHLDLGLAVAEQRIELGAAHRLDAARLVDVLDDDVEALRGEVRSFLQETLPKVKSEDRFASWNTFSPEFSKALAEFEASELGTKYPSAAATWANSWERFIPFLQFPPMLRKVIYTTNSIESLNFQLRKVTKNRGHFPSDAAAMKLLWLAIMNSGQLRWH